MAYNDKVKTILCSLFICLVSCSGISRAAAQRSEEIVVDTIPKANGKPRPKYIVFSGIVVTSDSLMGIPWVLIRSEQRGRLGYSDDWGHFSVVVRPGDSIYFEQLEKSTEMHVIPDTLTDSRYQVIKVMVQDTVSFPVIVIHALPPRSLLDYYFLNTPVPDDDYERARKNLEAEQLKEQMKLKPADALSSYKQLFNQRSDALYYYKQAPPQNWLSPVAWAKFMNEWKAGKYKKKKKTGSN